MGHANHFTLGGFTVTYSTFQMVWEVVEKAEDEDRTEISHVGSRTGKLPKGGV